MNIKSIEQHKLEGTYRPDRHADRGTNLEYVDGYIECPKDITGQARKDWEVMITDMCNAHLVRYSDVPVLIKAFKALQMAEDLEKKGDMSDPYSVRLWIQLIEKWEKVIYRFGVTPVESAKIRGVPESDKKNDTKKTVEKLLSAKGKA